MILLQYACRYTELERKLREEVSKLEVNLKAVRGERDASVETCKNTKKLYDELKASGGALATSQKGGPNVLLLGAIGIICAILGAVYYQIIIIYKARTTPEDARRMRQANHACVGPGITH